MDFSEELAQLEADIETAQLALARQQADLDALRARRDSLRRSLIELERLKTLDDRAREHQSAEIRPVPSLQIVPLNWNSVDLSRRQRTDAIVEILELSPKPMRIPEVIEALKITTHEDHEYQVVASTLAFLSRSGRVMNISRGLYESANSAQAGSI